MVPSIVSLIAHKVFQPLVHPWFQSLIHPTINSIIHSLVYNQLHFFFQKYMQADNIIHHCNWFLVSIYYVLTAISAIVYVKCSIDQCRLQYRTPLMSWTNC